MNRTLFSLIFCLLFPIIGFSQKDSFGRVSLATTGILEQPVFESAMPLMMDNTWGIGLSADIRLAKKFGLTVKYQVREVAYSAVNRAAILVPEARFSQFTENATPWRYWTLAGGLQFRFLEQGINRTIIEAYGGMGGVFAPAGVICGNVHD